MKKVFMSLAAVAAVFAGCQKPEFDVQVQEVVKDAFTASVENFEGKTKTVLDGKQVLWSTGDQLAIFQGSTVADKYVLADGADGLATGRFEYAGGAGEVNGDFFAGTEIDRNVALYPYAEELELVVADDEELGTTYSVSVVLPGTQVYAENSFANGAFTMVAVTDEAADHNLKFKNVLGAIKFQFTGTQAVQSVSVAGAWQETLAGNAVVTAYSDNQNPSIAMSRRGALTEVTLDCGEDGVQLGETATDFYVTVPPVAFDEGFTVTVRTTDGGIAKYTTTEYNEVLRSGVLVMPEIAVKAFVPISYDDVTFETEAGMTDVVLSVSINNENVTGFYGIFGPGMWTETILGMVSDQATFEMLLNNGFINEGFVANLYEGTTYNGPLSQFGVPEEYLMDIQNWVTEVNFALIVPVVEGKTTYTAEDLLVFEANTKTLAAGGNLELPACTMNPGYTYTELVYGPGEGIVMAKYLVLRETEDGYLDEYDTPVELPTEDTFLNPEYYYFDANYDSAEGMTIEVRNPYLVLPGAAYKVCIYLVDEEGLCSLHVVDAATVALPYSDALTATISDPEFDAIENSADVTVTVPAGVTKFYYTLNTQVSYSDYSAATTIAGILDGTSSFESVEINGETEIPLSLSLGSLNAYGAKKVAVHVICLDAEGNVSPWTSSTVLEAPKKTAN